MKRSLRSLLHSLKGYNIVNDTYHYTLVCYTEDVDFDLTCLIIGISVAFICATTHQILTHPYVLSIKPNQQCNII